MGIERYQRIQEIGSGMMSVVYLARDLTTHTQVVLKIMAIVPEDDKRNEKARERFLREIKIARSLQHPHILPLLDYGYADPDQHSIPYLVSPYIQEGSLVDLIKKTPPWKLWTLPQIGDVIMQAAESLEHLHTRTPHIVHEDVKPGNFLFSSVQNPQRAAYVYLCDFGISRWQKSASMVASDVLGTFAYMAPEQIEGHVDCASDQYALAVMSCYLLTGKLPLQAATNEEYIQVHLREMPFAPSQLAPERITSPGIDDAILRALEKAPEQRFPTILAFAETLQKAIMKQSRIQASAPTQHLDLAAAETVAFAYDEAPFAPALHVRDIEFAKDDTPIVIDPLEMSAERVLDEPLPAKPLKRPVSTGKSGALPLLPLNSKDAVRYDMPARPKMLCWSRSGDVLACVPYGYEPLVLTPGRGLQSVHVAQATKTDCVSFSPDGRVLAISAQGAIRFWDIVAQVEMPLVLQTPLKSIAGMDWSARNQLAIWLDNQIHLYQLSARVLAQQHLTPLEKLPLGTMRCGTVGTLRWSPDGTQLAIGASNGAVLCWHVGKQDALWHIAPPGQKAYSIAWSPDGTLLAVAWRNNRVVGWNTRTREQVFHWQKLPAMPRALSISIEQRITIASSDHLLLCGFPDEPLPSATMNGQLLAVWSPTRPELATLDEQRDTMLVLWRVLGTY